MFELLQSERYQEIIPLFDQSRFINSVRSHLERTPISKKVFVDDLENPQTAAILVRHRTFLGGNSQNIKFNEALRDYFLEKREQLASFAIYELDFYFASNDWIESLTSTFSHSLPYPRHYYEIHELKMKDWRDKLPVGYTIHPVDLTLLKNKHLENYDWLLEEIEENWIPYEEHLKEIRGYYIVFDEKEIVSWCTTEYLTAADHIEVGIATRNEHRKRGLATIVGSATAELCLSKYKTVGWHCNVHNLGSNKAAESIGFEKARDYWKVGYFFNEYDNYISHGYDSYLKKNLSEAIRYYSLVVEAYLAGESDVRESAFLTKWGFTIDKVVMEYASFYAADGKEDECLENIKKAIELGYSNIEKFDEDENLTFLHSKEEWREFRETIQKNR